MRIFIIDSTENTYSAHTFSSKSEAISHIMTASSEDSTYGIDTFEITHTTKSDEFEFRYRQLSELEAMPIAHYAVSEVIGEIKDWRRPESTGVKRNGNTKLITACINVLKSADEKLNESDYHLLSILLTNTLARQDDNTYNAELIDKFNGIKR